MRLRAVLLLPMSNCARSGVAAAELLVRRGAVVTLTDVKETFADAARLRAAGVTLELYGYRAKNGVPVGKTTFQADVAWAPQIIPGPVRQLSALAVVTREGSFQLLRRQVEPPPIPMPYPLGEEIPLTAIVPPPVTVAPVPPSETLQPGQSPQPPPTDAPISATPAPGTPPPGHRGPDHSGRL